MKKLLRTQDIFLLGLAGALDLFQEIRDPFQIVSKSYENMYGWVPKKYKRHNFNHLVWRSFKAGYIEKIEKKGEIYIRITSQGKDKVKRDFPIFNLQKDVWDKKWRIVMFDIVEMEKLKREGLRKKLKELGFGMLQESVFITPHDIVKDFSEYVDSIGLSDSVYILEDSNILGGDRRALARKIWKLDFLNEQYLEIFRDLTTLSGSMKKLNKGRIRQRYLNILLNDPLLPKELLPKDWWGETLRKLIKKLA